MYYFRGYVLFHGKRKLTKGKSRAAGGKVGERRISCLSTRQYLKIVRKEEQILLWHLIDYRKVYHFVPYSWILKCLDMFGIADNVRDSLEKNMKKWKLLFNSNRLDLFHVDVNRDIFQGDSLSQLIFVIFMIPLSLLLRKVKTSYEWDRKEFKLNHLLFMDDLKLLAKRNDQIDSLVQTVFGFTEDIGMELGLKKCRVIILKKGKLVKFDGIHLSNQEMMKEADKNGYAYLGILEFEEIKEHEMKNKVTAEYKRRLRLILKLKWNGKNFMQAVSTWAVVRC